MFTRLLLAISILLRGNANFFCEHLYKMKNVIETYEITHFRDRFMRMFQ